MAVIDESKVWHELTSWSFRASDVSYYWRLQGFCFSPSCFLTDRFSLRSLAVIAPPRTAPRRTKLYSPHSRWFDYSYHYCKHLFWYHVKGEIHIPIGIALTGPVNQEIHIALQVQRARQWSVWQNHGSAPAVDLVTASAKNLSIVVGT